VASQWERLMNHYDRWTRPPSSPSAEISEETEFFCPMHPNVVRADMGSCPICGMPLSQRARTEGRALPAGVLAQVSLTPLKLQLGRIATSPVEYRLLSRTIRAVGLIDYDETRVYRATARIKGRLDDLFVNYTGQRVEKGAPLFRIYSPDLFIAQREILAAAKARDRLQQQPDGPSEGSAVDFDSARQKLLLWGITSEQIDEIIRRGTAETHMTVLSPLAGVVTEKTARLGDYVNVGDTVYTIADLATVWMQLRLFEDELPGIDVGTAVEITSTAYPNEVFAARINFVAYALDPATRTVAARVEIANPDYRLKPGMYGEATIRLPVGTVTPLDPATTQPADTLATTALAKAYLSLVLTFSKDDTDETTLMQMEEQVRRLAPSAAAAAKKQLDKIGQSSRDARGMSLKEQRRIFKSLSAEIIALFKAHPPKGLTLYLQHCPMVMADWLAETEQINNPYYGSEMLRCGEVVEKLKPPGVIDDERYAVGFYCPIEPDRVYASEKDCPVDAFPTKFVKIEKALAVPESAVIDTGEKKVVYRESAPGEFDMLEVSLAPRAGEFYPVLTGLKAGDRVATSGAFLVDAENRLNPAAAVQYFGATGSN
jgi:multidrug efflux pump subunit AcrA (membrane-fusion protein)